MYDPFNQTTFMRDLFITDPFITDHIQYRPGLQQTMSIADYVHRRTRSQQICS